MKKGFTLIELLAVVVLLSILIMVSYTVIVKGINNTQKKVDSAVETVFISATEEYISDNSASYDSRDSNKNCLVFKTLLDNDYIGKNTFNSQNIVGQDDYMIFYGSGNSFNIYIDYDGKCK